MHAFRLPDIGEGIAEAEIVKWHVKPGDFVAEDQLLVDLMTDKATVEMTSPVAGRVAATHGAVGEMRPVGSPLVDFDVDGEHAGETSTETPAETTADAQPAPIDRPSPARASSAAAVQQRTRVEHAMEAPSAPQTRLLASPAVRRRAYEAGIPLHFVRGSGPGGRILDADLETYEAAGEAAPFQPRGEGVRDVAIVGLRRRIAEKMQQAKREIPHFGYVEEFDLTELEALRAELNNSRGENMPKLTLLPFFMRAIVTALEDFPAVNARFDEKGNVLKMFSAVHIGIATQTAAGLMVPVVRDAQRLNIWGAARELARVTQAARDGTADRKELAGSTITLTSLGSLGGVSATPIINHPEVAIIGPNKLVDRPVVREGQIVIRRMMNVSSAFDHRFVDGHEAASFVQAIKRLIEKPALLFIERS